MKSKTARVGQILMLALSTIFLLAGCNSTVEDTEGSVILKVTEISGQPVRFSVNSNDSLLQIDSITIESIPKNASGTTSDLMSVQLDLYQVSYRRVGSGSRTPPALVRSQNGFIEAGGTFNVANLPVLAADQLENPPLSDLLFENGAFDAETNSQVIALELTLQFFGKSVSGDDLATDPVAFVIEFTP